MCTGGTMKPSCGRQMTPQGLHPLQQLSTLLGVDQRHQGIADFQAKLVKLQQAFQRFLLAGSRGRRAGRRFGRRRLLEFFLGARAPAPAAATAMARKANLGRPGISASATMAPAAIHKRPAAAKAVVCRRRCPECCRRRRA